MTSRSYSTFFSRCLQANGVALQCSLVSLSLGYNSFSNNAIVSIYISCLMFMPSPSNHSFADIPQAIGIAIIQP